MKRFFAILLSALMLMSMVPLSAMAAEPTNWIDVADTSWYSEANKTVGHYVRGDSNFDQDTYTLTTAEQLAGLAKLVNEGNAFTAVVIKLDADIDLSAKAWTPIGLNADTPFEGHFDGQGNTIKGLNMQDEENSGLFGYIKNNTTNYLCSFENVTFENVTISGATNGGALFGDGKFAQRHEWYGGVLQVNNITVKGDVKVEGTNAGAVIGSGWLGVRLAGSNIVVNADAGSYIHGTEVAGGVFASSPHSGGGDAKISGVTSNIDVKGEGVVGGIAGKAGWYLEDLTCTGNITANGEQVKAGTIFGSIVDNSFWPNNHAVDYAGMTDLDGDDAELSINGEPSDQLFDSTGNYGAEFEYDGEKIREASASVSIDGGAPVLMAWSSAMKAVAGKNATITLTLNATNVVKTTEYGIEVPANTNLTIDLNGYQLYGNIVNYGDLTVKNGSLYSYEFISAIESKGENAELTIEDGTTVKSYRHALRIEGGSATINGGVFQTWGREGEADSVHALNAGGDFATKVAINGGEFRGLKYGNYAETADSSAAVNAQNNAIVTINGGTFGYGQNNTLATSGTGKIIIPGKVNDALNPATFDQDPGSYVAGGYKSELNAGSNLYAIVANPEAVLGNVHVYVYRNGDTETPYKYAKLNDAYVGYNYVLSQLDINDYYSSPNGFEFEGWYNDGGWNQYLAGKPNSSLDELMIGSGWTNIKCMVTDYEKVIVNAVTNGDKDNAETISNGKALKGSLLADYLDTLTVPDKTGYTLDKWYNWDWFGHKFGDDTVVNGWTNVYVTYTANSYTVTLDAGEGTVDSDSLTVTFDQPYGELPEAELAGHTFTGWMNAEGKFVDADDIVKIAGDHELTAVYDTLTAKITWMDGTTELKSETLAYGTMPNYTAPSKDGYIFSHWSPTVVAVNGPATYKAVYEKLPEPEPEPEQPKKNYLPMLLSAVTQVKVVDAETETAIAGATFELFRYTASGKRVSVGTFTSNDNGKFTVRSMSPRFTYELVQLTAAEGYDVLETPVTFRVRYNSPLYQTIAQVKTPVVEEVETPVEAETEPAA